MYTKSCVESILYQLFQLEKGDWEILDFGIYWLLDLPLEVVGRESFHLLIGHQGRIASSLQAENSIP